MAKAQPPVKAPRIMPGSGGQSIRDRQTGELRPIPETSEQAAEPAPEGK